ncbi:MAG TPA: hypothetical protein VK866_00625 [Acidimicrobiales bacterium]|nr:hypothetical protein [Acidimicrobiales bacterium]
MSDGPTSGDRPRLDRLPGPAADLAATTLAWSDRWYDPERHLLWNPPGSFTPDLDDLSWHLVPTSAWYAVGLLLRDDPGDADRAAAVLDAVVATQYDEPGTAWHGTYARFLEWPHPPPDATVWVHYDPNWRQFVGTALALVLTHFADDLPADLTARLDASLLLAVRGEPPDRVDPGYTNIALMRSWLDAVAGRRHDDPALVARGEALAAAVVERFDEHGAFAEHNSPTYYGIDLYALALWARRPPTPPFAAWGERLEAALWRDLASRYHAGLRELAGPWSRAYGMSLADHVGAFAVWVWAALGRDVAPLPDLDGPFEHGHDLPIGPVAALLGAAIPADAAAHLRHFPGERIVAADLPGAAHRRSTTWLADDIAVGAESCDAGWSAHGQYHPATAHWRVPGRGTAWLRVVHPGPLDAEVVPGRLVVRARPHRHRGAVATRLVVGLPAGLDTPPTETRAHPAGPAADSPGADPQRVRWTLPGCALDITVRGGTIGPASPGPGRATHLEITPTGSTGEVVVAVTFAPAADGAPV